MAEVPFAVNPDVFFLPQPVAQTMGAMPLVDIGVFETTLGSPGAMDSVMTDQFGGFGFGYGSQFGTVKSIRFTLTGPFVNNIAGVIKTADYPSLAARQDVSRNRTLDCYYCGHVHGTNLGSSDLCA